MEKFAVDLDAVLDEFELNEDQAEVAAARLQKQIEQGRLEIASSDTTPGSSYANSPRSSFAHLHEEPGRTVSPLVRPAAGIEPTTAGLTATNHRASADPPTNHRLPADPAANHSPLAEAVANHDPPSAVAVNNYTAPAYPAASEPRVPDVVAAGGPAPSSASSSNPGSPEHYPALLAPINGGTRLLITTDVRESVPVVGLTGHTPNGEEPGSTQPPAASLVKGQTSAGGASKGLGSTGQSEKAPASVIPTEDLRTPVAVAEGVKTEQLSSVEKAVPQPVAPQSVGSVTAQTPPPEQPPQPAAALVAASSVAPVVVAPVVNDGAPDVTAAPDRPDAGEAVPGAEPPTLPPDLVSRDPPAGLECGAEARVRAGSVDCQSAPGDSGSAGTNPVSDGSVQRMETPPVEPSTAAALTAPDVTKMTQEVGSLCLAPAKPAAPPAAGAGLSSLLAQVAAAPSPPVIPPTNAAIAESGPTATVVVSAAVAAAPLAGAETAVSEPGSATVLQSQPQHVPVPEPQQEPQREPVLELEPQPQQEPVEEPEQEPVRFQPADDVSESELETYLEQLEDDSAADSAPSEPPADSESFGGARPKTSPATTTAAAVSVEPLPPPPPADQPPPPEPEPAGAALQPLKGGVISRLQSQVSIECEVDSRSTRPAAAAAAENGRGSPPPPPSAAPVRPSSLDLPSRSQSIAEQPEPQPADDTASESAAEVVSSPDAAVQSPPPPPPPAPAEDDEAAAAAQESVSTTGGNIVTAPGAYEEARLASGRAPAVPASAAAAAARGQLVSLSDEDKNLGKVAPVWVPDEDAVACMECELKFTVIRRRHHCRACGRLLCSACCSERMCLEYMEFREGRVCTRCKRTIDRVQQESRVVSAGGASSASHHQMARPPNPNNPMEYCSTVPPTQQASHNAPPPTVMVPTGVLKRTENSGGRTPSREAKQVMFSDGIRPGGDLTEPTRPSGQRAAGADPELRRPPHRRTARLARGADRSPAAILKDAKGCKDLSWKPESGKLPPIYQSGSAGASVKQSTPEETIVSMIRAERDLPWSFLINKNLMVVVKMFKLDCCVGRTCWIFTSHGLSTVGQEEVVVILESLPDEATLPKDIFFFYHHLFAEAAKGHFVTELGNTLFSAPFLGSRDHGGFLYLRPTFQCLHNVPTPPQPFLVAVLIQKWEAPWAKVFPLRLLLRLGAEFRYYPCPLVSVRHRKPVFFEVGHTIINLLADFRNFAYVLPTVHGMHIHMEEQETSVLIPRNRFNQVLKAINNSNDHVLALGASFSREADSHLVCMQNEDGQYQTQAINIQNRPRQVTGASFVVFNGALKSAAGVTAKSSIVEDGLMFQISSDTMQTLRGSLRQMQDYKIECGPVGQPPDEVINIKWVEDDRSHNLGVRSVIDEKPLDGIPSIRVHSGTDYVGDSKLIRWTEVYLIKVTESVARSSSEPPDFSRLAEEVARGTCVALTPHLPLLADSERTRIGLRATVDRDTVGYEAGSNGEPLPPSCMNLLDSELVPVLHRYAAEVPDSPSCLELLFHVIDR